MLDRLGHAVLQDGELVATDIGDETAAVVGDGRVHLHQLGAGRELLARTSARGHGRRRREPQLKERHQHRQRSRTGQTWGEW